MTVMSSTTTPYAGKCMSSGYRSCNNMRLSTVISERRIEWDPDSDVRLPLVVIDGKALTWEQVGHMLMTFEGFTIEARIKDTIEVVGDPE